MQRRVGNSGIQQLASNLFWLSAFGKETSKGRLAKRVSYRFSHFALPRSRVDNVSSESNSEMELAVLARQKSCFLPHTANNIIHATTYTKYCGPIGIGRGESAAFGDKRGLPREREREGERGGERKRSKSMRQ